MIWLIVPSGLILIQLWWYLIVINYHSWHLILLLYNKYREKRRVERGRVINKSCSLNRLTLESMSGLTGFCQTINDSFSLPAPLWPQTSFFIPSLTLKLLLLYHPWCTVPFGIIMRLKRSVIPTHRCTRNSIISAFAMFLVSTTHQPFRPTAPTTISVMWLIMVQMFRFMVSTSNDRRSANFCY